MPKAGVTVTTRGPFFSPRRSKILDDGITAGIQDLVEQGQDRINSMARIRPAGVFLTVEQAGRRKASKGNYKRNISSFVRRLHGVIHDGDVIYGPWLEGTSSRNQTTRFKGYGMFRKTRDWLQRRAKSVVEPHIRRAMRKMNGR